MAKPIKILIRAMTYAGHYSGGRLHAWILAEGLSHLGYEVTFWGGGLPAFVPDFKTYPGHDRIKFHGSNAAPAERDFKFILVVPHMGRPLAFYPEILKLAAQSSARIGLVNFESANWFNAMSPEPRDPRLWNGWRAVARHADIILSSTREGTRYAREFYLDTPKECRFANVPPAINSIVADSVEAVQEKQVICITRFQKSNLHKGANDLMAMVDEYLRGYKLAIIVGSGGLDHGFLSLLEKRCNQFGVTLRLLNRISDAEKFREIKKSQVLVFCSRFEGFGYPPVEALYCNVPCVAYDLPVLHEVGGRGIKYVPQDDIEGLKATIAAILVAGKQDQTLRTIVEEFIGFTGFSHRLDQELGPIVRSQKRVFKKRFIWEKSFETITYKTYDWLLGKYQSFRRLGFRIFGVLKGE